MKLVIASDIHYTLDFEGPYCTGEGDRGFLRADHIAYAKYIHDLKPDVLFVLGDCAEGMLGRTCLSEFLSIYKNPHGDSICIPGNHDMWLSRGDLIGSFDPEKKYDEFYDTVSRGGWIGLRDTPFEKDGHYFVGNMCWYDFSMSDPATGQTALSYERDKYWSDYGFMRMAESPSPTPMLEYCTLRMAEFKAGLHKVPKDRKSLVVGTHMVGFQRLLPFFRNNDYGRAFFGNEEIGRLACEYDANYYFCGHSHRGCSFEIGNMKCVNNGSGYGVGSKRVDIVELV